MAEHGTSTVVIVERRSRVRPGRPDATPRHDGQRLAGWAVADAGARLRARRLHGDGSAAHPQEGPPRSPRASGRPDRTRAPDEPRRFTRIELQYTVTGDVPEEVVQRGIELSRDKYCSVWHSMRQDIDSRSPFTVHPGNSLNARLGQLSVRRGYLDWLRGSPSLIMIEAHIVDSWTRLDDRGPSVYGWSMILGGFGAPLFLFLAGVAVSRCRPDRSCAAAEARPLRRARLRQARAADLRSRVPLPRPGMDRRLGTAATAEGRHPQHHGPVDMSAAGLLWGLGRSMRTRSACCAAATIGIAFLTPGCAGAVHPRAAGTHRGLLPPGARPH